MLIGQKRVCAGKSRSVVGAAGITKRAILAVVVNFKRYGKNRARGYLFALSNAVYSHFALDISFLAAFSNLSSE